MSVVLDFEDGVSVADMREPEFLKPGTYHVIITNVEPLTSENQMDPYGFAIKMQVADGTVAGQTGKSLQARFNYPLASHKDGGKFCGRMLRVLFVATGLVKPNATGRLNAEPGQLMDMQFVVATKARKYKDNEGNERETIEVDGLKMFHIDEPDVANVPKNKQLVDACVGLRWTPDLIAAATTKHDGAAASAAHVPTPAGAPNGAATATAPAANYNDL